MRHSTRVAHGFTLIELLVVISIIATLAGLLIPVLTIVRRIAGLAACGNNQHQIIAAMIAYGHDRNSGWPIPDSAAAVNAATTPDAGMRITNHGFEALAAAMDLPNTLFKCRAQSAPGPIARASLTPTGDAWGEGRCSYAFDYSAPMEPPAGRVLIADRSIKAHGGQVMAGFADGHVTKLAWLRGDSATNLTSGVGETTEPVFNPDAIGADGAADTDLTPDNIYDAVGDAAAGTTGMPWYTNGQGSARRTVLK